MWLEMMKIVNQTREQMLIFQNETLKNQLNPHFLFNSLNTLSSLISVQPDKAEQFTLKLSDIYRYILENRENETVSLKDEIEFVKDYFFLQKIRDEGKIDLHFEIEDENCKIVPVSLQLLVENAFKHNASTREKPLVVTILQKGDRVEVRNNLQPRKLISESSGLGLENLSKRINMQTGKSMEIKQTADEFIVKMPLLCKQ
jgi:LytS/YehU family sensor histidine kinase